METIRLQILITGRLLPKGQQKRAISGLAKTLQISETRASQMLTGKATRLSTHFTQKQADKIVARMTQFDVECLALPVAASKPDGETAASMAILTSNMRCPKCGQEQPEAEICTACGVVIGKYIEQTQLGILPKAPRTAKRADSSFPYHRLNRLLQVIFVLSLGLLLLGYVKKDQLPPADFYLQQLLTEPQQTATEEQPFQTTANDIVYTIEPKFDYQLNGVVVSFHDSDAFIDIYHHKDWKDFINIRDLCVIWGDNVRSGVYRELDFYNATWTCWVTWPDANVAERFTMRQLSNNHLLANDADLNKTIMTAEPGDQISFKGMLASYSHSNGQFQRGTSITRDDNGNGACETVFLKEFKIIKKANEGWRLTYTLAKAATALSLLGILILLFVGPVTRRTPR